MPGAHRGAEEGLDSPGSGVTCGCWKSNPAPVREEQVLVPTETPLQPAAGFASVQLNIASSLCEGSKLCSSSFLPQMILTVFLSSNEQILTEVPITPETTCRDVVEFCKEPGEGGCHLAEVWRGSGMSGYLCWPHSGQVLSGDTAVTACYLWRRQLMQRKHLQCRG